MRDVRAKTIDVRRLSQLELERGRLLYPVGDAAAADRPRTRGDCVEGPRPCPWISCRHHLAVDVSARTGSIKVNFPDIEPEELAESCSLDLADTGPTTLQEVGAAMNLTRERVRQIEIRALAKLDLPARLALSDYISEGARGKRRLPVLRDEEE